MTQRHAAGIRAGIGVLSLLALSPVHGNEVIRESMEQLQATGRLEVAGQPIAARRVLPEMYERRGFGLLWNDPRAVDALLGEIVAAEGDGLDPADYHLGVLRDPDSEAPLVAVERDFLLSDALARLAGHLYFGKVDAGRLDPNWNMPRELADRDAVDLLLELIEGGQMSAGLDRLRPQHPAYGRLKSALARYRAIEADGGWEPVGSGPALKAGMEDSRVPGLHARLARTGDVATPSVDAPVFDSAIEAGVRRFQARHGLDPDGVVGPATLRALNVPVADRIDQIRVNLDRARWVLHQVGGRQVVVDIAGFEVYVLEEGQVVWRSRAQVGRSYRQTPVFRDDIRYLVVNPDWTVPRGILGRDILPRIQKDPGYLAAQNMRVLTPGGDEVDPATVRWSRYTGANFPYVLRQDPGPNNALGRIKIMFPNRHAVYLHDTPARDLFDRTERTFSSGCIRVEDAFELGAILLDDPDAWTRDRLEAAATGTQPRTLNLPRPWPVLLLYWTVSVGEDGTVAFRPDIYDRDPPVLDRLRARFPP